jgi:putative FmdB family regulatory protein
MPIYEYQCAACGKRTEQLQRVSDPPLELCPHCGGALRKLVSAPAFQLKGTGWYQSDYARKSTGGGGESGASKSESGSEKGAGGSTESASPAKSESSGKSEGSGAAAKPGAKAGE